MTICVFFCIPVLVFVFLFFAPEFNEFTVKFNCICQFIQISVCTVVKTKGVHIKGSDRKVREYMKNVSI